MPPVVKRAAAIAFMFVVAIAVTVALINQPRAGDFGPLGTLVGTFPAGLVFPMMARSGQVNLPLAVAVGWLIYLAISVGILTAIRRGMVVALFIVLSVLLSYNVFILVAISALGALR